MTERTLPAGPRPRVDAPAIYGSAAFLYAIAVMPGAIAPGFVGSAAAGLHLTESQLGLLFSMYFAGFGIVGASAFLWIRELNWKHISAAGIVVMTASFFAMGQTHSVTILLAMMLLNGLGAGLFGAPSITVLGDMTRPERGFSAMIIFSVVGAAILLAIFPLVDQASGFRGVAQLMGITTLPCLLLLPWLPRNNSQVQHASPANGGSGEAGAVPVRVFSQPLLALSVMVLFTLGFIGMWTFFERVAFYARLTPAATSNALAIGTLVGTLGAPLTAYVRRRMPMHHIYALVVTGIVATLVLLDLLTLTNLSYLLLSCSFQFWINAGFCIIMALIAEVDKVGRYVALIPASQAIGSFTGPLATGFALEFSGVPAMTAITVAGFVIGAGVFAYVDRRDLASRPRAAPADGARLA